MSDYGAGGYGASMAPRERRAYFEALRRTEAAEARLAATEARLVAVEARLDVLEAAP